MKLTSSIVGFIFLSGLTLLAYGIFQPAKALLGQLLLERAFSAGGISPWPGAEMYPVAKISIKRLKVVRIVVDRATAKGMAWGPGIVVGTKVPTRTGLSVIAGHRDSHMSFLGKVRKNDVIVVQTPDQKSLKFMVSGAILVDGASWRLKKRSRDTSKGILYLTTCWPLKGQTPTNKRFIVLAKEI